MMKNKPASSGLNGLAGLVYSTDTGRMCPGCRQSVGLCLCNIKEIPKTDGLVRVSLQTKGRGGKSVTLVKGLPLRALQLAELAKQLRSACGAGGTVKNDVVEVQGDHVVTIMAALQKQSYVVKCSAG